MNNSSSVPTATATITPIFVVSALVCVIVFVVGTIGNFFVLVIFGRRILNLKTCEPHYIYLVSLAFCDLLGSIVIPTDRLYYLLGGDYVSIGVWGCVSLNFITILTFTVSSLTLMAISVHRFVMIKWPFRGHATKKITICTLAGVWAFGCLPGVPYLMKGHIVLYKYHGRQICTHNMSGPVHKIHTLLTFAFQVPVPLLVMAAMYFLIVYKLIKVEKSKLFSNQEKENQKRHKRNKKTIKLLVVVVVMFFVCVTPANTFYIFYLFHKISMSLEATLLTFNILVMLQMCNNCINPLIYSKLHTSFRRKIMKALCCCCSFGFLSRRFALRQRVETYSSAISSHSSRGSSRRVGAHRYSKVNCADTGMCLQNIHTTVITGTESPSFHFNRAQDYRNLSNV